VIFFFAFAPRLWRGNNNGRGEQPACRARIGGAAWLLVALVGLAGCSPLSRPPNVLLITVDTLRADRLGAYGYSRAKTPNVDRLADEGTLFTDAIAAAPITMPSHASIMTGLLPPAHGVRDNGAFALSDDAVTLAERLKAAGYETRAFVSALVLNRRYNLNQGFESYDDDLWAEDDPKLFLIRSRHANRTMDRVIEWFDKWYEEPQRKPFFAWVHLFDVHQPYHPPGWARAVTPTLYDASMAYVDAEVGRLLQTLRVTSLLDDTIVVFTADHGESLGEHEEKTHAIFVYDATVRVPLIIRYPGPGRFRAGLRYDGPVRHVDIVPTLLDALRLPGAEQTQGVDLLPMTLGKAPRRELPQYSESLLSELGFGMAPLYAVRENGYKWIRAPRPELYDLKRDPQELNNLYPQAKEISAKLDAELQKLLDDSRSRAIASRDNPMNKETLEALQSLGYLQGPQERKDMGGMDPKDGILLYNRFEEARHLAQDEKWVEAETALRAILADQPRHTSARNILALTLMRQGRLADAKAQYLQTLNEDQDQARIYLMLATIAMIEDKLDEADTYLHEALRVSPQFAEAASSLGMVELLRGNETAARAWYDKALAIDPTFPHAYRRIADIYYDRGEYAAALKNYRLALERSPRDFRSMVQAGNSARFLGDEATARRYYEQAALLRDDTWIATYNLACLSAVRGDKDKAIALLREAVQRGMSMRGIAARDKDLDSLRKLPEFVALAGEGSVITTPRRHKR
jgi:arylsulfatase A-like enzyme/Flp pilus assembly protein TadD